MQFSENAKIYSFFKVKSMLAVVEIAGQQFEVKTDGVVNVPLIDGNPGDVVEFTNILLTKDEDIIDIGAPYLKGSVKAKIIAHGKDPKVLVFKKKKRKGYRKLRGHRQNYTQIVVTDINMAL
jgi:large subunit ribosomal protein L21